VREVKKEIVGIFSQLRLRVITDKKAAKRLGEHGLNKKEITELLNEAKKVDSGYRYSRRYLHKSTELAEKALEMTAGRKKRKQKGGGNVVATR
jgi:hypothetical protein